MKIAVLSGKGGTGKTFISVNLAAIRPESTYIDCDVEAPNGDLFFKSEITHQIPVHIELPKFDMDLCQYCRACVDFCRFNALAMIQNQMLVFDEVCHSCGGCSLICKAGAVSEVEKEIGQIEVGRSGHVSVITGRMHIGEASGVPIIHQLNTLAKTAEADVYIDCPPGSACVVMESIKEADYCIIVAEPSIYGVHNMDMVVELVQKFDKPFGVVINKMMDMDNPVVDYCSKQRLNIIGQIPYDDTLASLNAEGMIAVLKDQGYERYFADINEIISREVLI